MKTNTENQANTTSLLYDKKAKEEAAFSTLPKAPLTVIEQTVAQQYSLGDSPNKIAERLDAPVAYVKRVLRIPDVQQYVSELVDAARQETVVEARRLIGRMIQDQVETAFDKDMRLGNTTRKDIPDLLKLLQDIEKSASGNGDDSAYLAIIKQMSGGSS